MTALKDLFALLTRNCKPAVVVDPREFKNQVALRNQKFGGIAQFDVLEFMQYFFEFLNEETSMELNEEQG